MRRKAFVCLMTAAIAGLSQCGPPLPLVPGPRPALETARGVRRTLEREPLGKPVQIVDPSGRALDAFHRALCMAKAGNKKVHVLFYGASHTAADIYTGVVRTVLQQRFGDAGPGFVMPAKPFKWYRHQMVAIRGTLSWHTDRVAKWDDRRDGLYGLAGMSISSGSPDDVAEVIVPKPGGPRTGASLIVTYFLRQPNGGTMEVSLDGGRPFTVSTRASEVGPGYYVMPERHGPHDLRIRPVGDGEVRIFGVLLERQGPGVVVDTLGIPGTRARYMLQWNQRLWAEHLGTRDPDLLVLAYGTNESGDEEVPITVYQNRLREVLRRLKRMAPRASCLLIGPSDWPKKTNDGNYVVRMRTLHVDAVQRRVAREFGCGFFDLLEFMGGPLSMVRWVQEGMAAEDHVHFTRRGYERFGEVLVKALLEGLSCQGRALKTNSP